MILATDTIPVFVMGASGLLSGELMRLLEDHPDLELSGAISREAGRKLSELHPHLLSSACTLDAKAGCEEIKKALAHGSGRAALVLGLPHGQSAAAWRKLRGQLGAAADRLYVVDLSADYRLSDPARYEQWYGAPHADLEELDSFVYGLPETQREAIAGAKRVAAPGCFATALQLACLPAARAGLLDAARSWIFNAVTGSSGSGNVAKPGTHHPHRHGNFYAYGLAGHRHEAELSQALGNLDPTICFLPHSGPFVRGIHMTALLPLAAPVDLETVRATYTAAYEDEPFVEVLATGAPDLRRVVGSNRVSIGHFMKQDTLGVLLTLDNVIKGGAGQALQCLNRMLDLPEERGLPRAGLGVS